ncbi:MAG: sigma factor-like helix-turn-helix DNA-binding protein [Eubacteriales bacterium]|nr:sigma factor-like helix-turn-helix DNA-binding protein [Eubacteriales bacterium]
MTIKEIKKENDRKKLYLKRYRRNLDLQKVIEEEIGQLRSAQMMPAGRNDGMPRGSKKTDLSDYAAKLDEMVGDLEREVMRGIDFRKEITGSISDLQNESEILILRLKYIHGMTWEEVAEASGYSLRSVKRIHGQALINLKIRKK